MERNLDDRIGQKRFKGIEVHGNLEKWQRENPVGSSIIYALETLPKIKKRRYPAAMVAANRIRREKQKQKRDRLADNLRKHAHPKRRKLVKQEMSPDETINFDGAEVVQHNDETLDVLCEFCGSSTVLTENGKFTSCCQKGKSPTNEQLIDQFDQFPIANMMEVKHSPVTNLEYRTATNGQVKKEEEDLDTLFDENGMDGNSLTSPGDACDIKAPILNGNSKHPEILDIDLINDEDVDSNDKTSETKTTVTKKENEEAEDLDLFELDLEEEPKENVKNKEITDPSNVRDTGDDLDTLLSKINDLVEDCMESKTAGAPAAKAKTEVKISDEIVCLDSPLPATVKDDDDDELLNEEILRKISESNEEEKPKPSEEEIPTKEKQVVVKEEQVAEKKLSTAKPIEDEIFIIDDDDDDEPSPKPVESDDSDTFEKEIEKQLEELSKSDDEEEQKTEEIPKTKPSVDKLEDDDDDDDIVCLDDSLEEIDAKEDPVSKNSDDAKTVAKTEEEVVKATDKVWEKVMEKVGQTAPESLDNREKEPQTEATEKKSEEVADKVTKITDMPEKSSLTAVDDKKAPSESEKSPDVVIDDIVILDDDDEEVEVTSSTAAPEKEIVEKSPTVESKIDPPTTTVQEDKKIEDKLPAEEVSTVKTAAIISDNSDNARDGVEEKDVNDETKVAKEKAVVPSESNSNSSNLLKETAKVEREEPNEQPAAKRMRLSQDEASSRQSTASQEDTKSNTIDGDEVMDVAHKDGDDNVSLKRVHSSESVLSEFKKPKTEESPTKLPPVEPEVSKPETDIQDPVKTEPVKTEIIKTDETKAKSEVKPVVLYPPPKFDTPPVALSLDFLKRFKKSIHKMNKTDLEELVLQKIVEAIVHKSEFSEMRDVIEKLEKINATHRTKITELNKQFRDLEMVHNRVLKDLEIKNAQYIMPVKITRAVGLQVFFPNKKCDQQLLPHSPMPTQTPPAVISRSAASGVNNNTPERAAPVNTPATSVVKPTTTTNLTQLATVNNTPQTQVAVQRRGCIQKMTPLRPDTPRNSPLNRSVATGAVSSSTPSPAVSREPSPNVKILNRTIAHKGRLNTPILTGNVAIASMPTPPVQPAAVHAAPAEKNKLIVAPPGIATIYSKKPQSYKIADMSKRAPKPCQSDPQSVAVPLPASATIVTPQIPPSSASNTPSASKPPSKSVIDLTDEDDVAPTRTQTPPVNRPKTPAPPPAVPALPTARAASSVNQPANRGPYKVSVIPQQQLQQAKPNPPKQTPQRPIGAKIPIAPKPNGITVPVRQIPASQSRYRHPAPLPSQPAHSTNPDWKQPPARPTIRISNLESGIVISWTIEDTTKDKYAESTSYQIYAYQETSGPPLVESWRHVGDVKAMLLPMAVTLTQFQEGQRYYFAVRAVDAHSRCGPFSFAKTWS